ncbi:cysteine--tRNA ligase [Stygiobacter electus]|uniref:Cysteine--tRNA ligase n=1 Tax=Stygiobacter electus TaxID=3032292 RepID=A0AAE3P051_9BACT|nr:cysteine--tRNA ligase [Stygiobacter electus]MDF1611825.1 cysteine--tRNA ligase [Stygiobacter electus]
MQVFNTLTKRKEEFIPLNPPIVTMYMCGPTVYDYFHIGNARSFIMSDVIRRYLEYKNFNVKFVMNLTDVEDKIIKKANEQNTSAQSVSEFYANAFFEDINKLRIKKANEYPKATAHIEDMIELIKELEQKGIAYNIDGDVYYDITKFNEYGKLSGKKIDELEAGSRVEISELKRNPLDFALWKKAKEGEPSWDSPWGKGRPGWHIECSAMSTKHLGDTIDIHAGGNDLIFPHHENEIAQSEGAKGKQFVRYWIHFGFLNIQNEKMSKSLGNFFNARDILKLYSVDAIRFFFCQTHYRGPLNFSEELLEASEKGVEKIKNFLLRINEEIDNVNSNETVNPFDINKYVIEFENSMDDDFNTPKALAVIFELIKDANKLLDNNHLNKQSILEIKEFLKKSLDDVFGIISFDEMKANVKSIEDDLIKLILDLRDELKKEKNYNLADKIRNSLNDLGIIVQDSKTGTTYKKKF